MFAGLKKVIAAAVTAGLVAAGAAAPTEAAETGLQSDGTMIVSPAAAKVIGQYLEKVSGRFGALAISRDGEQAAYYICQSRLWKNCDEPGAEDSNIAIPSGKIARDQALTRCRSQSGAACILIFINDDQQRDFTVQP